MPGITSANRRLAVYGVIAAVATAFSLPALQASLQVGWGGQNQLNSLRAVQNGMRVYDGVEIDVRATKDGVVIGLHDPTLDRETTGTGPVDRLRWEELDGVTNHHGDPLAKLSDMLRVIDAHHGFVFLDVRDVAADLIKRAIDEASFPYHQARILVFDHSQGSSYISTIPGAQVYSKFYGDPNELDDDVFLGELIDIGYTGVAFPTWTTFPEAAVLHKLRELGLFTFSFVVDSQEDADRSTELGIDQVVVNGVFDFPNQDDWAPKITSTKISSGELTIEARVPRLYRQLVLEEYIVRDYPNGGEWRTRPSAVPEKLGPGHCRLSVPMGVSRKIELYRVRVAPPRGAL